MSKLAAAGLSRTVAGARRPTRERVAGDRVVRADRLVERRPRARVSARPAPRNRPSSVGAALADEDGRRGALGDHPGQRRQVDALVAAAGDQHDRRLERRERGDDRVRLRALRVVDEADAVDDGDRLEAVLDAGERRRGPPDGVRREPEVEPDGDRRQRVRDVVAGSPSRAAA